MKLNKIIAIILASLCVFSAGCSDGNTNGNNNGTNGGNQTAMTNKIVNDGKSDYVILIPANPDGSENAAANMLQSYLYDSSICNIQVIDDSKYNAAVNTKVISIGNTAAYKNSTLNKNVNLESDGFSIRSVDDDVFVIGGKGAESYNYAVMRLLNLLIDWEAYSYDEVYYSCSSTIGFSSIDITENPDFNFRYLYNSDYFLCSEMSTYRLYTKNHDIIPTACGMGHTVFKLLPPATYYDAHPKWYTGTDGASQLCWSQEDMWEELAVQTIAQIKGSKNATHVMIGQNDGRNWCDCAECTASLEKYGTNSAVLIKGVNFVAKKVQEYIDEFEPGREIKVVTFAYTSTEKPPVKKDANGNYVAIDDSVKLEPNAGVRIAPIDTDYSRSFYDSKNESYAANIAGWGALTDHILIWNYNTNFSFYFVPFCNYNTIQDNYRFYKENNVVSMMEQGGDIQIGFIKLRNYISSKLMWDIDTDYESLIGNFFENYYRDGSTYMRKYFDEYRQWYNVIEDKYTVINGGIYARYSSVEDVFPLHLIEKWEGYVNKAKEEIAYIEDLDAELYAKLYARIDFESLFFDYVRVQWYDANYGESDLQEIRVRFKEKCELYEINYLSETQSIKSLFQTWGLA